VEELPAPQDGTLRPLALGGVRDAPQRLECPAVEAVWVVVGHAVGPVVGVGGTRISECAAVVGTGGVRDAVRRS
jgi:hypothetical protein